MTTIYDIAKAVGVTQTTVANALAGRGNVSEATRKRILQCAQEMQYHPNALARGLAKKKTATLGFLLPTIANPFYPEIAEEIERIAQVHDYQMLLCNTHYDFVLGKQHLERLVSRWVDGIIVMGSSMAITDITRAFQHGLPTVLCDWQENEALLEIPQVKGDFYCAGKLAAEHLLSLGHQRIAIIVDEPQQTLRLEGFRAALQAQGLTLPPEMIQQGHSTLESGYEAAKKLLTIESPPSAIFATTDWMAIGALEVSREMGLRVPQDLSVLGLDDFVIGAHISPPLTTIAIPKDQLAQAATEMLLQQIEGTGVKRLFCLATRMNRGNDTMATKLFKLSLVSIVTILLLVVVIYAPEPTPAHAASTLSMLGADVSSLQRAEDLGAKYYYSNGTQGDPLQILKDNGVNYIRLRIWVNPANGYNNKTKVLAFAKLVKAKGLKLMIDFHYSDTWADPGHQTKPAAWANDGISQLQTDVYNYTYGVCTALKAQGTTPDSVQIGNEINTGMLWPDGEVINNNFTNLGLLLKSGYNATKACNSGTQVIIHTADADSDANARWFYDGIKAQGVNWDITGLSYYCYWHGSMSNMTSVVSDMISRYGKPTIIAETAYPFTADNADSEANSVTGSEPCSGYPATWTGQYDNFRDVLAAARSGGAIGVFYWEPTWIATPGNGWDPTNSSSGDQWDNQTLFNWSGLANPAIALFKP